MDLELPSWKDVEDVSGDGGVIKKTLVSTKEWKVSAHCFAIGYRGMPVSHARWSCWAVPAVVLLRSLLCCQMCSPTTLPVPCRNQTPARR